MTSTELIELSEDLTECIISYVEARIQTDTATYSSATLRARVELERKIKEVLSVISLSLKIQKNS